jgi:hypothetical protein
MKLYSQRKCLRDDISQPPFGSQNQGNHPERLEENQMRLLSEKHLDFKTESRTKLLRYLSWPLAPP